MGFQAVDDFKFQVNDTAQTRTQKLEALRLSAVKTSFTALSGDWTYILSDQLQGPGNLTPESLPLLTSGQSVAADIKDSVWQFDGPLTLGTRSWLPLDDGSDFRAAYRVRLMSGGGNWLPAVGFLLYTVEGAYLGEFGETAAADPISVADGWTLLEARASTADLLAAYPEAAYVRSVFLPGEAPTTIQIASARIEDLTFTVSIESAVAAAEAAAQQAIDAALAGAGSAETAAGYANTAHAWADEATGSAGASQASAVAAQSFADDADTYAQASSAHADVALTHADDAGASAAAAEIARLAAVAAKDGAIGQADIATTKAVEASNSAAGAMTSQTLAASFAGSATFLDVGYVADFSTGGLNSWTPNLIGSITLTAGTGGATLASSSGVDQYMRSPADLSIQGSRFTRVLVELTRTANRTSGSWDGKLFWKTAGHGESGSYMASNTNDPALNVRTVLVFDMTTATGASDWTASTITGLRFDGDQSASGALKIHSIRVVGPDGLAPATNASIANAQRILAEAAKVSAETAATLSASYSTGGGNLIPNTDFQLDTSGWTTYSAWAASFSWSRDLAGTSWTPYGEHTLGIYQGNTTTGINAIWHTDYINVEPGKFYEVQALCATNRCQVALNIEWYDYNGTVISSNGSGLFTPLTGGNAIGANGAGSGFTQQFYRITAPAGAMRARIILYKGPTTSGADSYAWFARPMLRQVPTLTGGPASYAPGNGRATITTVNAAVTTAAAAAATANGSIATLQTKVSTGAGNLAPNSEFTVGTSGWGIYSPGAGFTWTRDLAGDDWRPNGEHCLGIVQGVPNGSYGQWHSDRIQIDPSQWYEFSARVAAHRCNVYVRIEWYDSATSGNPNGSFISVSDMGAFTPLSGGRNIASWTHHGLKAQAPSNARQAVLIFIKTDTNAGQADSYAWLCRPLFKQIDAGASVPTPYTPSGNRATVETISQSVDGVRAMWGVQLNVSGKVTGRVKLDGTGGTSSFDIEADNFSISKSSGARTTFANGAWKVYDASGVLRVQMGNLDV